MSVQSDRTPSGRSRTSPGDGRRDGGGAQSILRQVEETSNREHRLKRIVATISRNICRGTSVSLHAVQGEQEGDRIEIAENDFRFSSLMRKFSTLGAARP